VFDLVGKESHLVRHTTHRVSFSIYGPPHPYHVRGRLSILLRQETVSEVRSWFDRPVLSMPFIFENLSTNGESKDERGEGLQKTQ